MSPRVRSILIVLVLLLLALLILLFARCSKPAPQAAAAPKTAVVQEKPAPPAETAPAAPKPAETLTAATIQAPAQVEAGAVFAASWTGPDNAGDYLTVVRPTARPEEYANYRETRHGATLELTAPMDPGEWEVRYVAVKSKTVLGRTAITVNAVSATLAAADEVMLGAPLSVAWTGPNNANDFVCIVRKGAGDEHVGNYADTAKGSPLTIAAPTESGDAEIRYVSGQGRKVLARRALKVLTPETSISAQAAVTAGSKFAVTWKGPANAGDYLTIVPRSAPDGHYRSYADVSKGATVELVAPIEPGEGEVRYMTGKNARVLARRPIAIVAAEVGLDAAARVVAGSKVVVTWQGPNNTSDYITIVPQATPDGQYGNYTDATKGSPLTVTAPIQPGPCEIRYMSGQGAKVLARRAISVVAAEVSIDAPAEAAIGTVVDVTWKGPNNPGDYFTVVAKGAKDGTSGHMSYTAKGSPTRITMPKQAGPCEIRYMSGQKNLVLARAEISVR